MTDARPEVVVVGAGPTGLALAIELGHRGIGCRVVEQTARGGYAPRAKLTNVRTREHLRRWGIADDLAAASPFGVDYPSNIHFVTALGGKSIVRFDRALNCAPTRDERYSEHAQWIPQYKLEAALRAHAETLPTVRLDYGRTFIGFEEEDDVVSVRVADVETGVEQVLETRYLVGADGARSSIRDAIGATMVGRYGLSRNFNIIFEAPGLAEAHPHGDAITFWQLNDEVPSIIGPMDVGDLWYFAPTKLAEGTALSEEDALSLIRRSTRIDLPYRIKSADEWVASRLLADRYSRGSVFLIGDACHLHPPFGGFGMNLGIGDAVDLGWKIAAVLQGWGGPALLSTYEAERRPVHEMVMEEAEQNHKVLPNQLYREGLDDDTPEGAAIRAELAEVITRAKRREFYALSVILGYDYRGSSIVAPETEAGNRPGPGAIDYVPDPTPGCLAPHAWLADGRSLYDLFGAGFTLLVFDAPDAQTRQLVDAAASSGVPLAVVHLPLPEMAELYRATRVLVRPDQHVAWKGDALPAYDLLALATGHFPVERDATAGNTVVGAVSPAPGHRHMERIAT